MVMTSLHIPLSADKPRVLKAVFVICLVILLTVYLSKEYYKPLTEYTAKTDHQLDDTLSMTNFSRRQRKLSDVVTLKVRNKKVLQPLKDTHRMIDYLVKERAKENRKSTTTKCSVSKLCPNFDKDIFYGTWIPRKFSQFLANEMHLWIENYERCTMKLPNEFYAELATWKTRDPACQPITFTPKEICRHFTGKRFLFVGDSVMRQVYTSFLFTMSEGFQPTLDRGCQGLRKYHNKTCEMLMLSQMSRMRICNGNLHVAYHEQFSLEPTFLKKAIHEATGRTGDYITILHGIHHRFESEHVINEFIAKAMSEMGNSKWPRVMWIGSHMIGHRQPAQFAAAQSPERILKYNHAINSYLKKTHWAWLDMYSIMDQIFSCDGIHYSLGGNIAKLDIVLQHFLNRECEQTDD